MSLQIVLQNLSTRIATECKAIRTLINGNAVDLSALTTTAKTNLVAALNEVKAIAAAASAIADGATASSSTWSSQKINDFVAAQVLAQTNSILGGASAAYDTLQEIQLALQADDTDIAGLMTALGNRVRFDGAQALTTPQKAQACANIGVGDPETDFVATFVAGLV